LPGVRRNDELDIVRPRARPPEPGLAPRLAEHPALVVEKPRTRLVGEERTSVVADRHVLAEGELGAGRRDDAAPDTPPHADERKQGEQRVVERRARSQVGRVRDRHLPRANSFATKYADPPAIARKTHTSRTR
jgi:hypothetical protein